MIQEIGQEVSGIGSVVHAVAKALAELYGVSVTIELERFEHKLTVKYERPDIYQRR